MIGVLSVWFCDGQAEFYQVATKYWQAGFGQLITEN
jgi:hypothetical protein